MSSLRTATAADLPLIRAIASEVWPVAYSQMISPEQISYMLGMMYSDESLSTQMKDEGCEFVLCENESEALGFGGYSEIATGIFKLHKLYVLSTEQSKGTGKKILEEICRRTTARGGYSIELQVNKRNKAKEFYLKNHFVTERELVVDIGQGFVMDDFVMRRML